VGVGRPRGAPGLTLAGAVGGTGRRPHSTGPAGHRLLAVRREDTGAGNTTAAGCSTRLVLRASAGDQLGFIGVAWSSASWRPPCGFGSGHCDDRVDQPRLRSQAGSCTGPSPPTTPGTQPSPKPLTGLSRLSTSGWPPPQSRGAGSRRQPPRTAPDGEGNDSGLWDLEHHHRLHVAHQVGGGEPHRLVLPGGVQLKLVGEVGA